MILEACDYVPVDFVLPRHGAVVNEGCSLNLTVDITRVFTK